MSYDGPFCSERLGPNFGAGSTASEMAEFYGDPSNGDYDVEHVVEVERYIAEEARLRELREMRDRLRWTEEIVAEQVAEIEELRAKLGIEVDR